MRRSFVVNFFHALQYFAIVWWIERAHIGSLLRSVMPGAAQGLALAAFLGILALLGAAHSFAGSSGVAWAMSASIVVSLMHFWWDGFIWSVRRREV